MGCAASKEITVAKSGSKLTRKRGSWKRMFIPIVNGLLFHKKPVRSSCGKAAIEQKESVKTLADALEEETAEFLKAAEEEETEPDPEVINVRELMKGLEEEEEDAERILPQAAETPESRADHNAEGAALESSSDESLVSTDQEEVSSSFCNSSPEFVTCLDNTTVVSPRSPLCFDSPVQCPPRQKVPICKRYGRGGDALDTVQVTRNFSFNLRSSQEQASTPKVILDSSSPLLKSETEEFKWRLIVKQQEPDQVSARGECGAIDSSDPDIDGDLLSTFETMLEQISSDDWASSTRTSTESPGSSSDAESFCTQNAPDLNNKPQEVTLYFAANDQQCSTAASILMNHGIPVETKDISMDPAHREELARLTDCCAQVPALFINGRYIGGADKLNRKDELRRVLDGARCVCPGCGGICLVPCLDCNGSRRFLAENGELEQCHECTENGMVRCPLCSSC